VETPPFHHLGRHFRPNNRKESAVDPRTLAVSASASSPVATSLPSWPNYEADEIEAAGDVLRSGRVNYWTGEIGRQFEREYAESVGTRHAVAVANGTLALELALHAIGIGPGDEVIVPPRTFVATATSVLMQGARPVFADVEADSGNLSAATIEPHISPRTKAIICVHLAGWPCEMDDINLLAQRHGLRVVEDCAQAHGATYRGWPVGSLGDIAAFSFCQDKIITTGGEGGMVTTNDDTLWNRAWSYKDHGKDWDAVYHREHPGVFRWVHDHIGTNWRLTEMQSAIGRIQLRKLADWSAARARNAQVLHDVLSQSPDLQIPQPPAHVGHAWYKWYAFLSPGSAAANSRDAIVRELQRRGVPAGCGSCGEIYNERGLQSAGLAPQSPCEISRRLAETSLMFPVHPTLTEAHMEQMGHELLSVLSDVAGAAGTTSARAA
jgi:dTDP-4-amino-4,6-dideoxygalactose transaminase